ncbi:MAG: hypothetical protein HY898_35000 [Deltaproteobacteria bacterium]|nr:hypothetical protein [Deltaproteobacteria bacterium]
MMQAADTGKHKLAGLFQVVIAGAALCLAIAAAIYCVLRFEPLDLEEPPVSGIAYESSLMGWRRTVFDTPYGPMPIDQRFAPGDRVVVALRRGRWTRLASVSWARSAAEYEFERASDNLRKTLAEPLPEVATPPRCAAGQVREGYGCCSIEGSACRWDQDCCSALKCNASMLVCAPR